MTFLALFDVKRGKNNGSRLFPTLRNVQLKCARLRCECICSLILRRQQTIQKYIRTHTLIEANDYGPSTCLMHNGQLICVKSTPWFRKLDAIEEAVTANGMGEYFFLLSLLHSSSSIFLYKSSQDIDKPLFFGQQ